MINQLDFFFIFPTSSTYLFSLLFYFSGLETIEHIPHIIKCNTSTIFNGVNVTGDSSNGMTTITKR